ncbi:MAG: hypothetical protein Fur0012_03340 [Elusimicrobiota bacterium]
MNLSLIKFKRIEKYTLKWEKEFRDFYRGCLNPRMIKNPDASYFAAYFNDILAGHCALVKENGKYVLEGLRVRPQFREMGIGKELTRLRLLHAIDMGAESVWYCAADKNLVSICCHMKFGFKKVCSGRKDCKISEVIWYRLDLKSPAVRKGLLKEELV